MNKTKALIFLFFIITTAAFGKKIIGNPLYSKNNFTMNYSINGGFSGTKDYLHQKLLFQYTLRSKNRHTFGIRTSHIGFIPGLFSKNTTDYIAGGMLGASYLYKAFSPKLGIFTYLDLGLSADKPSFLINAGIGIGNLVENGILLNFTYSANYSFLSELDFYFTLVKFLSLRGNFGIQLKYEDEIINFFNFYGGFFPGFNIKNYFKLELGGGFTINDYNYLMFFLGSYLTISFDF